MQPAGAAFGWPTARQGPQTANQYATSSNPILRGYSLATLTTIVNSSSWLQSLIWKMNKFDQLKFLSHLANYQPRYDPTVIPKGMSDDAPKKVSNLDIPVTRQHQSNYHGVGDYIAAYRSGRLTPLLVVEKLLPIIQDQNNKPNRYSLAYLEVKPELVMAAARASTERWASNNPLSPLDGVPIAVKDEFDLAGYSRNLGSSIDMTNPLGQTAWCVRKLEEAGAIIIGKTNMHQFGLDTNGNNPWRGTPLMPHNEKYYPGGSSSGSGVTIAQGICPVALGADGGGSIRVPSSFCGIYGLKPSHGRISAHPTQDLACSVGVSGPMASDLDSLKLAYRIMAQPDPSSQTSRSFPNTLLQGSKSVPSKQKVIGICREWIARSDPDMVETFNSAVQYYCTSQGYKTVDITLPYLPEGQKAHALTILSEVGAGISQSQIKQLSYPNQLLLNVSASRATAQDFLAAQRIRNLMMEHLAWLWEQHPDMLILTPTIPYAGWKVEHPSDITSGFGVTDADKSLRTMEYVYLANWTGCPAMSRPMGYSKDNVPIGLMAMGPWGSEEQLITWARQGEGMLDGGSIRRPTEPGTWVDVLQDAAS